MGNLDIHQCSSVLKQSTSIENVDQKKSKKNYWQFWKLLFTANWRWLQLSSLFSGAANVWILLCRDEFRLLKFEPEGNDFLIRAAHKSFEGIMELQWIIKVWQSWWGNFWDDHHIMIHCIFRLFTLYHNTVILITSDDGFTLSCSNSPDSAKDKWSGADFFHPETKKISQKVFKVFFSPRQWFAGVWPQRSTQEVKTRWAPDGSAWDQMEVEDIKTIWEVQCLTILKLVLMITFLNAPLIVGEQALQQFLLIWASQAVWESESES